MDIDRIILELKCPKCGIESPMICETSEIAMGEKVFGVGDFVPPKNILTEITKKNRIFCSAECRSFECLTSSINEPSNEPRGFKFKIFAYLRGDLITGEYIYIGEA